MSGTYKFQPSFAAGVLGPGLFGRIDLAKYTVGLKTGKNIFVHAHGGFSNRAGTVFVGEVDDSSQVHRLIPFERDDDTTYALVFGDETMQLVSNGELVDYSLATPYAIDEIADLNYVQSIDVMYLAHPSHYPQKLEHYAETNWAFEDLAINPDITAPDAPTVKASDSGSQTYNYKISLVVDGVESLPSDAGSVSSAQDLSESGAYNTVSWDEVTDYDVEEYRIYRELGGVYAYIGFTTDEFSITDKDIDPDTNTAVRQESTIFSEDDDYPSVVTLAQQRLIWAASNNDPETVWASVIGDYENYTRSAVLVADDRFIIDVSGEKLNEVKGLATFQELLAFSGSGEFGIGSTDGTLSATEPAQRRYGANGSNGVRPLLVDDSVVYVDRSGRMVRDLRYDYQTDGYSGNDLTLLVPHYFMGKSIIDWAYCHSPYGIVWAVLDDGSVVSMTYNRKQDVYAWTEHDFGGEVESVCAVSEDTYDILYLLVKRTVDGETKRYIERMQPRLISDDVMETCFLDCAIEYDGDATDTISGLDHLEGETVSVLGDGNVFSDLTVTDGQITLNRTVSHAYVGLSITAEAETLPLSVDLQGSGNSRGLPAKATEAFVQMEDTRGISVSTTSADTSTELVLSSGDLAADLDLYTGLKRFDLAPDWNNQGTIIVQQTYPLPMTVLGISPKWSIGRG